MHAAFEWDVPICTEEEFRIRHEPWGHEVVFESWNTVDGYVEQLRCVPCGMRFVMRILAVVKVA